MSGTATGLGRGGAFEGLKVVELAQLIAAPMAGSLLADLGADVVHVEMPDVGDPQRVTGVEKDGVHLWWKVSGRNKRSVTLDLGSESGQGVARRLIEWADVVITNFRPPALTKWGLDWESAHALNPRLIMLHVSGYGLDTSKRDEPGFGKVGEAMSGVVHLTGDPNGPPTHTGFSHGDATTGLFGAFSIGAALYRRASDQHFEGELIDLALFEALFRINEWQVIVFDQLGVPPMRAGNRLANAPAAVINTYLTSDDVWLTVTSGTPKSVRKIAALLNEPAEDYDTKAKQWDRRDHLDDLLRKFVSERIATDNLKVMQECEVVASRVYDVADIVSDPTYIERQDVIILDDPDLGKVRMPAVLPKLKNYPGAVWRTGASLGQDNDLVFREYLGLSDDEIADVTAGAGSSS
ncbi:MAG TPA: CoA transferase [Mycobacteriales bacterium]|jgi:formyl-CoA transferase|nr:CoA transferase [Mycobacteriales bacterium]